MSKTVPKKKEPSKVTVSQFLRSNDDEIKVELEAMMNLEYNLHSDYEANDGVVEGPQFTVRKSRSSKSAEASKQEKQPLVAAAERAAKMDKQDAENRIQTYVPNASMEELQNVVRQAAVTSEDKYKILDARDRLMRAKQTKTQLSMARATRGTCPDMCPEKERMMRESQRQVAAYELLEGADYRINHETAVKQYSRSSADQEEPLPQDLRPVESLKMTMSYLLHEIADLCQQSGANLAEWYHFLWDRTRGIRKDITQQELCCRDSVELVEQCARFHIVCAERLCAEEVSVFDKKINTENLTKCLQTLKYMYHDLRVKGQTCENEPEFRAYIILLNLNNGNFMWDVQRLPAFVQKSPEVRFAIEVYSSIESNNYAKFFRLVRETTYPNACILLRYFNQVRVKAISVMVKAYCRTTSTAFPLYELIDILGFEDENDAIYVCEQVGLNLSKDELHIMLNRQNFSLPMSTMDQGRAINIVESKRIATECTYGQCIAGEIMPDKLYVGHKPHNSFDSMGYLKPESLNADDQNTVNPRKSNDPYNYMDEDVAEPVETSSSAIARENPNIGFGITNDNIKSDVPHVFKMPATTTSRSNVFSASIFAKPIGEPIVKKTEDKSPFVGDSIFGKSSKRMNEIRPIDRISQETKISELASIQKPQDDDRQTTFGKTNAAAVKFSKTSTDGENVFNVGSKKYSHSTLSEASNIFGKPSVGGIFGNAGKSASIFATSSSSSSSASNDEKTSKNEKIWSERSSIFDDSNTSLEHPRKLEKSSTSPTARQRQEIDKKREIERRRTLEIERKKMEKRIDVETSMMFEELETEIIHDVCSTIVKHEIERSMIYEMLSVKIVDEILDEYVNFICDDTLNREIVTRTKLEEFEKRSKNRLIAKYYKIWRNYANRKIQQRNALDVTPVWLQTRSIDECAKSFYRDEQKIVIENMRRKRFKRNSDVTTREFLEPIETRIYAGIKENAKTLDIVTTAMFYWKMGISWPDMNERPVLRRLRKILGEYVSPSDFTSENVVKIYKPNSYETLHICVRQFEGVTSDRNLTGTDGLFFVATSAEDEKSIVRRLTSTILSRNKLMPIPVIVVVLGETNYDPRDINLRKILETLVETGNVSEYKVDYEKNVNEQIILDLIQRATLWLTVNKSPSVPLEMNYLNEILDTCLTKELWHRILGHSAYNAHLETALEDVDFVIDLHNEAVTHLIDIVLDPEALEYTDFPPEFKKFLATNVDLPCGYEYFDEDWKNVENREKLERIINELSLPKWTFGWPIDDTMELHKSIALYCRKTIVHSDYNSIACHVLSKVLLMSGSAGKTSFVQLILEIVGEKIRSIEPNDRVVYNKNHVKHFRTLPWWFKSNTFTNYNENFELKRPRISIPMETTEIDDSLELYNDENSYVEEVAKNYKIVHEKSSNVNEFRRETRKRVNEFRDTTEKFEKILAEQKDRSRQLEKKLEAALDETDDDIGRF